MWTIDWKLIKFIVAFSNFIYFTLDKKYVVMLHLVKSLSEQKVRPVFGPCTFSKNISKNPFSFSKKVWIGGGEILSVLFF